MDTYIVPFSPPSIHSPQEEPQVLATQFSQLTDLFPSNYYILILRFKRKASRDLVPSAIPLLGLSKLLGKMLGIIRSQITDSNSQTETKTGLGRVTQEWLKPKLQKFNSYPGITVPQVLKP